MNEILERFTVLPELDEALPRGAADPDEGEGAELSCLEQAARADDGPQLAMLYFHPWEFDPDQPRLPLGRLSRWRTYVGVSKTTARLDNLLTAYPFTRAIDAVRALRRDALPRFKLG